jgi:hypothetical protein
MNRYLLSLFGAACVLALAAGSARAGNISYNYDWTKTTDFVNSGTGSILFATASGTGQGPGSMNVMGATVTSNSNAAPAAPDVFNGQSFTATVLITDLASSMTDKVSFVGHLFGALTQNSAAITGKFDSPMQQTLHLGANLYTITIGPFIGPNFNGASASSVGHIAGATGSLNATIGVQPFSTTPPPPPPPPPSQAPEPTALLLAAVGLGGGLFGVRRAARRKAVAA